MNTENNGPGTNRDNNSEWNKEQDAANAQSNNTENNVKGSQAPNKNRDYNVLNPDGSLPDLPDDNVPGTGALDGTVGLGT